MVERWFWFFAVVGLVLLQAGLLGLLVSVAAGKDLPTFLSEDIVMARRISKEGEALIKEFEGCRLEAYRDIKGVVTIGYGTTGRDIRMGLRWTEEQCEARFQEHLRMVEGEVEKMLLGARVPDSVFSAICSWVYNVGVDAARKSTLIRKVRKNDLLGAWAELSRWVHVNSALTPGLIRRRKAEQDLWNTFLTTRRK